MREVVYCPGCQRRLQLPDDAMGKSVQCPSCQRIFVAEANLTMPPTATPPRPAGAVAPPPTRSYEDDIDRPRRSRRDDDSPRGSRRFLPHRGGEILTFGFLALLPCCLTSIIFGIVAWMMANADLSEMRSGRMDRDGEGLTQAGRALGIAGLVLWPGVFGCFWLYNLRL